MGHRMRSAVAAAAAVAAVTVVSGAGAAEAADTAGAASGPSPAGTGWVVANPDPDGLYETHEGSATLVNVTSGVTVSCTAIGGWGRADSGTLRPQDVFGETGMTTYGYEGGCTGPAPGSGLVSTPGMVFAPEAYDAATDTIDGAAYPWLWALALDAPGCFVEMYAEDPDAAAPLTYDNGTGALEIGPVVAVVTSTDGPACAGLAQVGDTMAYEASLVATPTFTVRPL